MSKKVKVEVFFDYSSPWSYLLFTEISKLNSDKSINLLFKPTLVGVIFNKVNDSVYKLRQSKPVLEKLKYSQKDILEWAAMRDVTIRDPYAMDPSARPNPFPVNSAKALRGGFYFQTVEPDLFLEYSRKIFHVYWGESQDISKLEVLKQVVRSIGYKKVDDFQQFVLSDKSKSMLKETTAECISREGFGVPTVYVNEKHMYFGNDRMPLILNRIKLEKQKSKL
eukprot:snap_masked-scaffold_9-processed-gene-10.18-mRNA-1 protein AED:1.00 eAED:1.00 QI:0/-1/0/0/-1/1/1/0/222